MKTGIVGRRSNAKWCSQRRMLLVPSWAAVCGERLNGKSRREARHREVNRPKQAERKECAKRSDLAGHTPGQYSSPTKARRNPGQSKSRPNYPDHYPDQVSRPNFQTKLSRQCSVIPTNVPQFEVPTRPGANCMRWECTPWLCCSVSRASAHIT